MWRKILSALLLLLGPTLFLAVSAFAAEAGGGYLSGYVEADPRP